MDNSLTTKMRCVAIFVCLLISLVPRILYATESGVNDEVRKLSGIIVDFETGESVIGASIAVVGQKVGAVSDIDGNFTIDLPEGEIELEFSCIGYKSQRITVKDQKTVTVMLHTDSEMLEEAVAIGYGTTARKDLTGSIASVNVSEMKKALCPISRKCWQDV